MEDLNLPAHITKEINETIEHHNLITEIEVELKNNPKYKEFFEKYNSRSLEDFIKHYSHKKALWMRHGEIHLKIERDQILKYNRIAEEMLWFIQQKKLFDMQCLWRAGKIKLPGVESTFDFLLLDKTIQQCNFIPPITDDEFNLLREFVLSNDFSIEFWDSNDFQEYPRIKNDYLNSSDTDIIPDWYLFCYNRKGGNELLLLPDIRGDKERFYEEITWAAERNKTQTKPLTEPDRRPYLNSFNIETLQEFVEKFEDRKIKDYFRAMELNKSAEDDDDLQEIIETLNYANEYIEPEPNLNWRESLIKTAHKYEKKKIYEELEKVYSNYLTRLKSGIAFELLEKEKRIEHTKEFIELFKRPVLKGRKLNNEPEDFNF